MYSFICMIHTYIRVRNPNTRTAAADRSSRGKTRRRRQRLCTATRFTRQQMIDMGLVPPEESGQEQEQTDQTKDNSRPSTDDDEERGRRAADEGGAEEGEPPEAVGLIGHFEAANLAAHKGREGSFMGSLDMSMTERDLISTKEGVGEYRMCDAKNCHHTSYRC